MNMFAMVSIIAATALDPGVGSVHYAVSTKNASAQRFFDQGMAYMYGFNHEAAIRAFEEAGRLDPQLAMAEWGKAYALGPNINLDVDPDRERAAYAAVQLARKKNGSAKEKELVEALAKRYTNDPKGDLKKLSADYSSAMGALHGKYPADDDIATMYAESLMDLNPWKFWSHNGKPAAKTGEIVAVLESVLRRTPAHLGANHYYIHAVEASPHPERALASAKRIATLAPSSGHLVHMPAHIYQRTGNYAGAAGANARAADVDRAYIRKNGAEGIYPLMYYNHNLQFGSASYAMIGQYAEAKKMAAELAATAMRMAHDMPMVESAASSGLLVDLRFARYDDVIKSPPANAGQLSTVFTHFARGVAFARLGRTADAEKESAGIELARKSLTDDPGILQNLPKPMTQVASALLAGRIAEAKGDRTKAVSAYRQAVEIEDSLNYNEPADWFYPTRETLGGALLRAGRAAEAEKVFRLDLEKNRNNPRSLFGLWNALDAQKKSSRKTAAAFQQTWKGGRLEVADL